MISYPAQNQIVTRPLNRCVVDILVDIMSRGRYFGKYSVILCGCCVLPNQKRTPNSKTGTRRGPIFSKKGTLTTLEDPKLEFFGIVHKELICGRPATSFQE